MIGGCKGRDMDRKEKRGTQLDRMLICGKILISLLLIMTQYHIILAMIRSGIKVYEFDLSKPSKSSRKNYE